MKAPSQQVRLLLMEAAELQSEQEVQAQHKYLWAHSNQ